MKRMSLLALMVGVLASQACADMYTLDSATALGFEQAKISSGDTGLLTLVTNKSGTSKPVNIFGVYASTMQGQVGFVGALADSDLSGTAWMIIGGAIAPGTYDGFRAYIANDDNSAWAYRLGADSLGTIIEGTSWTPLAPGTHTVLELPFSSRTVTGVGFEIMADYANVLPAPSTTDAFNTSVVPLPPAVVLGFLGLGLAGVKLRRFA